MLRHAAIAPFAVFASQWHANHARDTEVLFIKLPQAQELINNLLLLSETTKLRNKARFVETGAEVEVATQTVKNAEC